MSPQDGKKALQRILGKHAAWRENRKAATAEQRADANAQYAELRDVCEDLKVRRDARRAAVLRADREYQALVSESNAAMAKRDLAGSISRSYRLTVGRATGIGFFVRAEGDNWQDVIDKLSQSTDA